LWNGTVSIKDGRLDSPNWTSVAGGTPASYVSSFALAGRRILIKQADGLVYAKEGDLFSSWYREPEFDNASNLYVTPTRIGALVGGALKAKDGLGDGTFTEATSVSSASLARQRIAVTLTDGTVYYKDGPLNATWSGQLASGADAVYLGGSRICTMYPSGFLYDIVKCQEGAAFSSTWNTIHNQAYCVRVNDVRLAICDAATGNKVGAEGPLTNLGPWITLSTTATDVLLN
jgi:hypothetical protein